MSYEPNPVPESADPDEIKRYIQEELRRINADVIDAGQETFKFDVSYAEPAKPRDGMVVYADGSTWNPNSGQGFYYWNATLGAWVYMGSSDLMLDIPAGNKPNHSAVNKFGGGIDATADTATDVWDGGVADPIYPYPATALITDLAQVADQVALRGATINVQGLDASWNLVSQDITLHATDTSTPVVFTAQGGVALLRVFRMKVMADVVATSDIYAQATLGGQIYAIITTGFNQTLMALYTVPNGYTAYMTSLYASVTSEPPKTPASTEVKLFVRDNDVPIEFQLKFATGIPEQGGAEHHHFAPYYKFTQKSDIKIQMECIDQIGHIHAGFDLILVLN